MHIHINIATYMCIIHVANSMQVYVHVRMCIPRYILYMYIRTYIHTFNTRMYILEVTIPQSFVLTYNSSSGADGSHIIEYEILHNSEIHICSTDLLTTL